VGRRRVALVTGISGQDGSYLADLLLEKGYAVHGIIRRCSTFPTARIDHIFNKLTLHYGDLSDAGCLRHVLQKVKPDEIYNLGAQSHVRVSFDQPEYTVDVDGLGVLRLLEAMRDVCPKARLYQASSSEMFGSSPPPQNEKTPFCPQSPYACAKVYAYHQIANYRDTYGLFAVNGILFNHESERRGETFVTRKITRAVGRIAINAQNELKLGNLDARRDWGYAPEYVEAMWMMLQGEDPEGYVIATGTSHTVKDFARLSFSRAGLDWEEFVKFDKRYLRPSEVTHLKGDASKAKRKLGWEAKTLFSELVNRMVDHDATLAENELAQHDPLER
jgi:GDPmannose 4,6-dehydratase